MYIKNASPALIILLAILSTLLLNKAVAQDEFNIKSANRSFDKLSLKLATKNLDKHDFRNAVGQLEELQKQAMHCLDTTKRERENLQELQKSVQTSASSEKKIKDSDFILKKKERILKREAGCRLFIFRTEEAVVAYKQTLKELSTHQLESFQITV